MKPSRRLTPIERLYSALHRRGSADQRFVVRGDFADLGPVNQALHLASQVTWEARIVPRGGFWAETSPAITVRTWTEETDPPRTDIFRAPIEVYSMPQKNILLFQIFHGLMDAQGALLWIENVLRALRSEPVLPTQPGMTEKLLLDQLGAVPQPWAVLPWSSWGPRRESAPPEYREVTLSFQRRLPSTLSRLAVCLATAWGRPSTFLVPVDLRRHQPGLRSAANLSLPLILRVEPNETPSAVWGRLIHGLKNKKELNPRAAGLFPLAAFPPLIAPVLGLVIGVQRALRASPLTAVLTHVGTLTEEIHALPLRHPLVPYSVVASESATTTTISLSARSDLVDHQRWESLISEIKQLYRGQTNA